MPERGTWGSKDKKPCKQHSRWLECFGELVARRNRSIPLIVAGDFNQRVPRVKGNKEAAAALENALCDLKVVTGGTPRGLAKPGIDHIAVCPVLSKERVWGWPRDDGGVAMSDHDAAAADLRRL